jgi:hypothetical protein
MEIKNKLISNTRLSSQKIATPEFNTPKEIVKWMGAMQAQDYSMAKWAIGVRLQDPTDNKVESSLDKGEILRIHLLRPTWHLVSADDVYWILNLTASKVKSSLKSRHKQLELSESVIATTSSLIEKVLVKVPAVTRDELAKEFNNTGIRTDENRLSHILFCAELDGIICSGPSKGNKQTYSLLSERVPAKKQYSRDESLAELAKRYFTSRCPATIQDFIWWSNLSVTDAKKAIELNKNDFYTETMGSSNYLIPNSSKILKPEKKAAHLLPAYDEFLISYKDRSSSLSAVNNKKTVSDNGMFYPTIIINGQVTGIWKRTIQRNKLIVALNFFQQPDKTTLKLIEYKANKYGKYLLKETEVKYLI